MGQDATTNTDAIPTVPIYSIGYGARSVEEFVETLRLHDMQFLIDVRSHPYSRFKPEFSREQLERSLHDAGVRYVFMGDTLGGRPEDRECYTEGRVDYAKCREKPFFQAGLARLKSAWEKRLRVAMMCSEGKPEECHRSKLIGVSLTEIGVSVMHIDEAGDLKTQEEVLRRLTGGQRSLFSDIPEAATSRKVYLSPEEATSMPKKPKIVTIGVYGFSEEDFFRALTEARVDTFCDIRQRRGMRGSQYAFVNSTRLQEKLGELGIRYIHIKELAPSEETRDAQRSADEAEGVAKRDRTVLGEAFKECYTRERLSSFNSAAFIEQLGGQAEVVALFCVEREPGACHRSLVAEHLERELGLPVEHVRPCESPSLPRQE